MKLGCTYIKVSDMEKSVIFYSKLLQIQPQYSNKERWVMFHCGSTLALYNLQYDIDMLNKNENIEFHYNEAYIKYLRKENTGASKTVVFNFNVDNLNEEFKRVKNLNIGKISEIMYVNITMPYYFFIVDDPDGNEIEVTGNYIIDNAN
ncbi:VOC family protein [Clostridium estertheticum]|uniref:VOC family protein n=1 Tax=Clostridium estertheticum TaxID=238834 RepID=UPI001C0DBCEE|nr:VOC family protein [Clostridium estertheticum]MBU3201456.1 VOC family protein [Clostridium estertheticum]WAG63491.1 VOC family protein [Clostridium estertheticum]